MNAPRPPRFFYRIRYAKLGKVRFTSHRDTARIWERALRRAELPVARSEGFNPHPKLSFGLALPTGAESIGEYLDVELTESLDEGTLPARLDPCLPVGFHVQGAAEVEPGSQSLQQAVVRCTWRTLVRGVGRSDLAERLDAVLGAEELVVTRERKGQPVTDDVRPTICSLELLDDDHTGFVAELAPQPRGLRPDELVALLGDGVFLDRVCRLHQWINADGASVEPLALDLQPTPARALETSAP